MKLLENKKRYLYDYYTIAETDIEYTEDGESVMVINGRKHKIYMTMSMRVPDSECCRVRIKGKWYYFG